MKKGEAKYIETVWFDLVVQRKTTGKYGFLATLYYEDGIELRFDIHDGELPKKCTKSEFLFFTLMLLDDLISMG